MNHTFVEQRKFGTDPEFAVVESYNSVIVDDYKVEKLIPPASYVTDFGMKFKVNEKGKREFVSCEEGSIIEDGAAFEFNVKPSEEGQNLYAYVNKLSTKLNYLICDYHGARVSKYAYAYFDPEKYWKGRDKSFVDCVRFGCDPDYFPEIYLDMGLEKEKPHEIDVSTHTGRYFGGHLHTQNMTDDVDCYVNQQAFLPIVFDFFVGMLNCIQHREKDFLFAEKKRLEYYGHPGRGRLQKYSDTVNGYEYRPLSNYWLLNKEAVFSVCAVAHVAAQIVENYMAKDFFFSFRDKIPEMWDICLNLDGVRANPLLDDCISWAVEKELIFLEETTKIYRRIEYL